MAASVCSLRNMYTLSQTSLPSIECYLSNQSSSSMFKSRVPSSFFPVFFFFFFLQEKKIHYLHYLQCGLNTSLDNTTFYLQHSAYWLLTLLTIQNSAYNSIHTALNLTLTRLLTTAGCKHATENRRVVKKEKRILSLGKRNVCFFSS